MTGQSLESAANEPAPLHELISKIIVPEPSPPSGVLQVIPMAGTLQPLNRWLETRPVVDFANYTLRGIGQVIFANNPFSGFLILVAIWIQAPWVGLMGVVGVVASTVAAILLNLDRDTVRNGIFGFNGFLVGAALATFSVPDAGLGRWGWAIAVAVFAAFSTVLMKLFGTWWAKTFKSPPLTLPFNIATLLGLALILWLPQSWFELASAPALEASTSYNWLRLGASLPIGFGQVFLAGKLVSGGLILLAVAMFTPLGALVGLLGGLLGLSTGVLLGIAPDTLYAGLWEYNAILSAMAIGGVFYAPNFRSIAIGAIAAVLSALVGGLLGLVFSPLGLPVLTVPFCVATIGCFVVLQRSLPSLVPVALHAVTSPEEHQLRYRVARDVIAQFRRQLAGVLSDGGYFYLMDRASNRVKDHLQQLFNYIDRDRNHTISTQELSTHLRQEGQVTSETDLDYLFSRMDSDRNGTIDFEEFGELMLRHRRLMANYRQFATYFLPIDANGDDAISLEEMNVAMASVGEARLSEAESAYIDSQMQGQPLTWNRFIEMLLVT